MSASSSTALKRASLTFRIYGTGHVMDGVSEESTYVGTVVCAGGDLVWHMYEVLEVSS
jgi:hypothetical protein